MHKRLQQELTHARLHEPRHGAWVDRLNRQLDAMERELHRLRPGDEQCDELSGMPFFR